MKYFWWIFAFAILCAIFSKQIDKALTKYISDCKKRAVVYCVVGAVALAVIGVLIYKATAVYADGWPIVLVIAPAFIFIFAAVIGLLYGRIQSQKRKRAESKEPDA